MLLSSLVAVLLLAQPYIPDPLPEPQDRPAETDGDADTRELPWATLAEGIEHATLVRTQPVLQTVQLLRIDLKTPGLEFVLTPANGERELETDGQTASAFASEHGLTAAVNAHFFSPCCAPIEGQAKDLTGLAIADGELVSEHDAESNANDLVVIEAERGLRASVHEAGSAEVRFARGSLTISTPRSRRGIDRPRFETIDDVVVAIAGNRIVVDGKLSDDAAEPRHAAARHPRTAAGVADDGRTLYLVVVDGRQPGHSLGATISELAQLMIELGCEHAINLDGGGSSTMVASGSPGSLGEAIVLNQPSAGRERVNGSHVGVRTAGG